MTPEDLLILKDDRAAIKEEMEALSLQLSEKEAALTKAIEDLQAGFRLQNAGLIESVTVAEREFERKDKELRAAVVAAYTANPASKTVASGLSVRVAEKAVYNDEHAVAWAVEKQFVEMLKIDSAKFKKAAEALKPDFVAWETSITAVVKD